MLQVRINLMRIQIRIRTCLSLWCGSGSYLSHWCGSVFRIRILDSKQRLKTLKNGSNKLLFHTFWLVICKMIWIRSQLITLIGSGSTLSIRCGCESGTNLSIWCGSTRIHIHTTVYASTMRGVSTLLYKVNGESQHQVGSINDSVTVLHHLISCGNFL
jgi:hypothetical protein